MFRFLIVILSLLLSMTGQALTPLTPSNDRHDGLQQHFEYLRSNSPPVTPQEVLQRLDGWQPIEADAINFGFDTAHYWLRAQLSNTSDLRSSLALEIAYALLDHVDVYLLHAHKIVQQFHTGDNLPFRQRPIQYPTFIFPLNLAPNSQYELLIHVQTESAVQLPITLWQWPALTSHAQTNYLGQGLFFGITFIMALYNLFIWFGERDPAYIFYVCYITTFAVFQMAMQGIGFQLFWPDYPQLNQYLIPVSICLFAFFISRFVIIFFDLQKIHKTSYYAANSFGYFYGALAIICWFLPYHVSIRITAGTGGLACIMMLSIAVNMLRQKHPAARYFTLAWSMFLTGGLLIVLNKFNILPRNFLTENAIQIGAALEVMFLSLALAERMVSAKKESLTAQNKALRMAIVISEEKEKTYQAQQHALHIEKEANRNLEATVQRRTEELEEALNSLSILNSQLKDLSLTDALTGLLNRRAFDEYFASEFNRSSRDQTPLSLILLDIDHFKRFNDTYGHQAGDTCLVSLADLLLENATRRHDACCRFGGEEFAIIMPNTSTAAAYQLAEELRKRVANNRVNWDGQELQFTVSLGIHTAIATQDSITNRRAFIALADSALYSAKGAGRNRVAISN
jgi:two-component system, sensor histidine kinase LadS